MRKKPRSNMTPVGHGILQFLADGQWHNIDEMVDDLHALVPPGRAWRVAERQRQKWYKKQGIEVKERQTKISQEAIIVSGQRKVTKETIRAFVSNNRLEAIREENRVLMVRLRQDDC